MRVEAMRAGGRRRSSLYPGSTTTISKKPSDRLGGSKSSATLLTLASGTRWSKGREALRSRASSSGVLIQTARILASCFWQISTIGARCRAPGSAASKHTQGAYEPARWAIQVDFPAPCNPQTTSASRSRRAASALRSASKAQSHASRLLSGVHRRPVGVMRKSSGSMRKTSRAGQSFIAKRGEAASLIFGLDGADRLGRGKFSPLDLRQRFR